MVEKIQKLPHPGLRNIKTAIAASFCLLIYHLLGREDGVVLACIAVFICMQDSVDKTWKMGIDRAYGALLGGLLGVLVGFTQAAQQQIIVTIMAAFFGIVLLIFLCNLLKISGSIVMGLSTFVIIVFGQGTVYGYAPWFLAVNRTVDTLVGIAVAVCINTFLFRPRPEKHRGTETINPAFHYEYKRKSHHKTVQREHGKVEELYIFPEDAIYQDQNFSFRVAKSTGETEIGKFGYYPGFKRKLMLIDGELYLDHKGEHKITLGQYETDVSLGAWQTDTKGRGEDLSILTAEDFCGKIELLHYNAQREFANDHFVSFYALEDGAKLYLKNDGKTYKEELSAGDYIIVSWFFNGEESYTAEVRHAAGETEKPLVALISCKQEEKEDGQTENREV